MEKRYFTALFWTSGEGLDDRSFPLLGSCTRCMRLSESPPNPHARRNRRLKRRCTSMCRHMYNLIIVGCNAKQPASVEEVGPAVGLPRHMLFGVE